jgi:hypothetical protein
MIPCPSCPRQCSGEVLLAAHLIDAHGLTAPQAAARAQQVAKDQARNGRRVAKKGRGRKA